MDIPKVELSPFLTNGDDEGQKKAKDLIKQACSDYGFSDYGLITRSIHLSRTFFALPDQENLKYSPRSAAPLPAGYSKQPLHSPDKNEYLLVFQPQSCFNVLPADFRYQLKCGGVASFPDPWSPQVTFKLLPTQVTINLLKSQETLIYVEVKESLDFKSHVKLLYILNEIHHLKCGGVASFRDPWSTTNSNMVSEPWLIGNGTTSRRFNRRLKKKKPVPAISQICSHLFSTRNYSAHLASVTCKTRATYCSPSTKTCINSVWHRLHPRSLCKHRRLPVLSRANLPSNQGKRQLPWLLQHHPCPSQSRVHHISPPVTAPPVYSTGVQRATSSALLRLPQQHPP